MKKIYLKTVRDMRGMLWRVAFISCMIAVVVFDFAGSYMGRDSLYYTRDKLTGELRLADVQVLFTPASPDEMPDLSALEKEAVIVKRLATPGGIELKDGKPLACVTIYIDPKAHPAVNDIRIIDGKFLSPDDDYGVVIEKTMAEMHGFRVGDTVTMNLLTPVDYTVRGICITPECLLTPANPRLPVPSKGSLGIMFASMNLIEATFGYPLYNDLAFLVKDPARREAFKAGLRQKLGGLEIKQITPKEAQFGYNFLTQNLKEFNMLMVPEMAMLVLITAIVIMLTFNRLVVNQKKQIGITMALGYTNRVITSSYVLMALFMGITGAIIGGVISYGIGMLYAGAFAHIVGIPQMYYVLSWRHILMGAAIGLVVSVAAALIPLRRLRNLSPQVVIREEPEVVMHTLLTPIKPLEDFIARCTRNSISMKIGLRNIFRRPRLFLATTLIIALSISLSTVFLICLSSFEHLADKAFAKEHWDAVAGYRNPLEIKDAHEVARQAGLPRHELMLEWFGRMHYSGKGYHDVRIVGVDEAFLKYRDLNIKEGRMFTSNHERAVLYNNCLSDRKFAVGEMVSVETGQGTFPMRIVGMMDEVSSRVLYMPMGTAEEITDLKGKRTSFLTVFDRDPKQVESQLYKNELVEAVALKVDFKKNKDELFGQVRALIYITLGISVMVSLIMLFASVNVNILDRQKEYATLMSLGLTDRRLIKSIYIELAVEIVLALALSVPISIGLAAYLNHQVSHTWPTIETFLRLSDFLKIMIPALVILPLAAMPGIRSLIRMDIAGLLRSRAIG